MEAITNLIDNIKKYKDSINEYMEDITRSIEDEIKEINVHQQYDLGKVSQQIGLLCRTPGNIMIHSRYDTKMKDSNCMRMIGKPDFSIRSTGKRYTDCRTKQHGSWQTKYINRE